MKCIHCEKEFKNGRARDGHMASCKNSPSYKPRPMVEGSRRWRKLHDPDNIPRRGRYDFFKDEEYREKQRKIRLQNVTNGQQVSPKTREIIKKNSLIFWSKEENKVAQSIRMQKAVRDHPDSYSKNNVVGRVKNIDYNGHVLKGSWELLVAETLDFLEIEWTQPSQGIEYFWNNSIHMYFPDFYLPDRDLFIEVKGYERDRDRAKWACVQNIIIVKKDGIDKLKRKEFSWFVAGMTNGASTRS